MAVKNAVLALLIERPSYGYQLMQRLEDRFPDWGWAPNGIYSALNKLSKDGHVRAAGGMPLRDGERAAPRTIYKPTTEGLAYHQEWFAEPSPLDPGRQELDMKIQLATLESLPVLIQVTRDQELVCLGELSALTGPRPLGRISTWHEATIVLGRNAHFKGLQFRIERLQEARSIMEEILQREQRK
jgi:DNA-binding PadR family transcriptional regulator